MQIIISRHDFDGSNIAVNGKVIPVVVDRPFEASSDVLNILADSGIPYVIYDADGAQFAKAIQTQADTWSALRGMNSVEMYKQSTDVDYTAAILRAVRDKAPGMPLYIPGPINVALTGADALSTEDLILTGPGRLIYSPGKEAIYAERPMEAAIAITPIDITTTAHILSLVTNNTDDFGDRLVKIQPPTVTGFVAGDKIAVFSQDVLPMSEQVWGIGYKVFNKQLFRVKQLGIAYTGGSAFIEGQTVVGATSGATASVRSAFGTAAGNLLFDQITGTFQNGETLNVGGSAKATVSGTAYLAVKGKIYYSFTTSPIIRKMSTAKFMLLGNIGIGTATDQNALIGAANRKAAISLFGQDNPILDVTLDSMYSKGVQLTSCFQGNGTIRALSGANNANTGSNGTPNEAAYSYPLEIMGATTGGFWQMFCSNVRHGVSSNTWQMTTFGTSENNYHKMGFPCQATFTGKVRDTWSACWDLHECAFDMRFLNCEAHNPGNGKRNVTQGVGIQNRGNGTEIINPRIHGAVIGILDGSRTQTTGFAYVNRIEGGLLTDIGLRGISDVGVPTDGLGKMFIKGTTIECDNLWTNSPWSGNQAGIHIGNVAEHEIEDVTTRKIRGNHWHILNAGNVLHSRCHFDHSFVPVVGGNSDNSSNNIRIDNAALNINSAERSRVTCNTPVGTGVQQPTGFYRYGAASGSPVLKVREEPRVINKTSPLALVVNTGGGSATGQVDHGLFSYADDAAAGTAGVVIGGQYLKAGAVVRKVA